MDQWRSSNFFTYHSTDNKTKTETEPWTPDTVNHKMTSGGKPTEIKLNLSKIFMDKQNDLNKFLQDVTLYLSINKEIYDKDEKKIAFMLARKMDKVDQAKKDWP